MPILETGATALGAMRNLSEVIQRIRSATSLQDAQIHAADLVDRVLAASQRVGELVERTDAQRQMVDDLKTELQGIRVFAENQAAYKKRRFNPGIFAYVRESEMESPSGQVECFCAYCFENQKLATLQATGEILQRYRVHFCPSCKNKYSIG